MPGNAHDVAVHLPLVLRDQVRERARPRGLTITDLVEEAFAQQGDNYHDLTAAPAHRARVDAHPIQSAAPARLHPNPVASR